MDLHYATLKVKTELMETNEETQRPVMRETSPQPMIIQTLFESDQSGGGRRRRRKSDVWKEFVSVGKGDDGKERGRCIHCSSLYVIQNTHGTSHLRRHLRSCRMNPKIASGEQEDKPVVVVRKRTSSSSTSSLVGVSVSQSKPSCDNREEVMRAILSKNEGKKRSAMMIGLDILDCPICFKPLTIPIFQCDNGHLACSSCCPKLSNKCPTCGSYVGNNRCRPMEIVIESVFNPCKNAKFGCTETISYGKEATEAHEKECGFSQCKCPALNCEYTGSYDNIYSHFVDCYHHGHISESVSFECGGYVDVQMNVATDKILVICESKKRLLFVVQCFKELSRGVYVSVRCIAPSTPGEGKLGYSIDYYSVDGHSLTYKSQQVKRVVQVSYDQIPLDDFLFVPNSLLNGGELLEMKIAIGT